MQHNITQTNRQTRGIKCKLRAKVTQNEMPSSVAALRENLH